MNSLAATNRYTFSSLMSLLIQTEGKMKEFYERTDKEISQEETRAHFKQCARNSSRRIDLMQKARVERVMEMTLEPITDLNLTDLITRFTDILQDRNIRPLEKAVSLEKTISELYARTYPRIMQTSPDTGELLIELSHESLERQKELERYVRSLQHNINQRSPEHALS